MLSSDLTLKCYDINLASHLNFNAEIKASRKGEFLLVVGGGRTVNSVLLQVVLDLRPSTFWKYLLDLQIVAKQQVVNQGLEVFKFNFHL